jgi:hypothetical protein
MQLAAAELNNENERIVYAGVYSAELPLALARRFAHWINAAQLLAADCSFIDNMHGMNVVINLMLTEAKASKAGRKLLPKPRIVKDRLIAEGFAKTWEESGSDDHLDNAHKCLMKMRNCPGHAEEDPLVLLLALQDTRHADIVMLVDPKSGAAMKDRQWEHDQGGFLPKAGAGRTMLRFFGKNDAAAYYTSVFLLVYAQWCKTGTAVTGASWESLKTDDSDMGKAEKLLSSDLEIIARLEQDWNEDPDVLTQLPATNYFLAMKVAAAWPKRERCAEMIDQLHNLKKGMPCVGQGQTIAGFLTTRTQENQKDQPQNKPAVVQETGEGDKCTVCQIKFLRASDADRDPEGDVDKYENGQVCVTTTCVNKLCKGLVHKGYGPRTNSLHLDLPLCSTPFDDGCTGWVCMRCHTNSSGKKKKFKYVHPIGIPTGNLMPGSVDYEPTPLDVGIAPEAEELVPQGVECTACRVLFVRPSENRDAEGDVDVYANGQVCITTTCANAACERLVHKGYAGEDDMS